MRKKTILIIDDDGGVCRALKASIEDGGRYTALTATRADAGLELVRTQRPDLVLLDLVMPDLDGLEVLRRIKAMAPALPVAMVTGVWSEAEAAQCFQAGAYEYLTKPVDVDHLKTALFVKLL